MNPRLLALTFTLLLASPGLAQTTPTVPPAAPTLSVRLAANAKLDRPLTLVLPSGAPLGTVVAAISRSAGLTLLARDVPPLPVTLGLHGLTSRAALEQLLSLYQDQVQARLIGDTLIVAPSAIIDHLQSTQGAVLQVMGVDITDDDAIRLSTLTGAQVLSINKTTVVNGTPAQIARVQALLQPAPSVDASRPTASADLGSVTPELASKTLLSLYPDLKVTVAYGRAYLQAESQSVLDAAVGTLAQLKTDQAALPAAAPISAAPTTPAVPTTAHRTYTTLLDAGLVTRLASITGPVKLTPLDPGTYAATGTTDDLAAFESALHAAELREALRVTVTYPGVPASAADGLTAVLGTVGVRSVSGALEVRGTPQEQVRASAYLAQFMHGLPVKAQPDENVTVRVPLSYALPSMVASQLTTLYSPAQSGPSAAAAAASGSQPTASATTGTGSTPPAATQASSPSASATPAADPSAPDVRIVADERGRAIILSGPGTLVKRMQQTVADLDVRLKDVRMALKIEQVSGSNGQDLGLDWNVGLGGFSVAQSGGALSAGFRTGVSPLSLSATLNLARSEGRAHTLLDTTFVAQDGRSANFKNGGKLLLPSSTTTSTGTTTTGRDAYEYGLNVTLTPRLAPDGHIEMQVNLQLGDQPVDGISNSVVIASRTMTSTVTVSPGEPLILGGVLSTADTSTQRGIPVLSQIPVIGALFGNKSDSTQDSVLLITLQAADRSDERAPAPPALQDGGVTRVSVPPTP